jgi:sulfite exporter TauE/SafE
MIFLSALLLGITGSFHCLGMCAPLLWLMPHGGRGMMYFLRTRLLYQAGRLGMYALLGMTAGFIGHSVNFEPFQSIFLAALGLSLVFFAIFSVNPDSVTAKIPFLSGLSFRLSDMLSKYLGKAKNYFWAGAMNGLVPCGLVYTALLGAVGVGDWANGLLYMLLFGAGTFPVLFAVSMSGKPIQERFRNAIKLLYPIFLGGTGLLLLYKAYFAFTAWQNASVFQCH